MSQETWTIKCLGKNMSMLSDYYKEKADAFTIENEFGFLIYQIIENEFYIQELYIVPDKRITGAAKYFLDESYKRAKEAGCTYASCSINIRSKDPETPLIFNLKNGYKIHSLTNEKIILTKEI